MVSGGPRVRFSTQYCVASRAVVTVRIRPLTEEFSPDTGKLDHLSVSGRPSAVCIVTSNSGCKKRRQNDDHNPQRIGSRNLFDVSVGHDNLFKGDRYKWSLRFTVINLTNQVALYNFFSTFSGTHYVTPRSETVELGFHF